MLTTPSTHSLVELARRKKLPRHQYIDHATLMWIEENRPEFQDYEVPELSDISQDLLHRSAIPANWLTGPERIDALHGIRHSMRTAAFAALLAEATGLAENDTVTLVIAAALHDCRRWHDKDDRDHGARSAFWLEKNAASVWGHFNKEADAHDIRAAVFAVFAHDISYEKFSMSSESPRVRQIVDLLKAADALDRYQQPKLSWWPDSSFVHAPAFDALRPVAFELVVSSEAAHLAGCTSTEAVSNALKQQGLVN